MGAKVRPAESGRESGVFGERRRTVSRDGPFDSGGRYADAIKASQDAVEQLELTASQLLESGAYSKIFKRPLSLSSSKKKKDA